MQLDLFEDDTTPESEGDTEFIECPTCAESKPIADYYNYDYCTLAGARRKCKVCYNKNSAITRGLRKANPYPYKSPQCDSCGITPTKDVLALDHCHIDNTFRGWLCRSCNTGIGALGDDIEGLKTALTYLRNHYER